MKKYKLPIIRLQPLGSHNTNPFPPPSKTAVPEEAPQGYPNPYARRAAEAEAEQQAKTAVKENSQ